MMALRIFSRITRRSIDGSRLCSSTKVACQLDRLLRRGTSANPNYQRFGFSSSTSPQSSIMGNEEKETKCSKFRSDIRRKDAERTAFSESVIEPELSADDLVKLVAEKEELLKLKNKEIEELQDKVLSAYAEMENVLDRIKHESESSKDYAIKIHIKSRSFKMEFLFWGLERSSNFLPRQNLRTIFKPDTWILKVKASPERLLGNTPLLSSFLKVLCIYNYADNLAKSLSEVADNLGRASSVVKESFSKMDSSKGSIGAVALLKTLLDSVEITDKQLSEVFRKFGVEKFDPNNECFDPNSYHAIFQIFDTSISPAAVAAVAKVGYVLYGRVLRPVEAGVTQDSNDNTDQKF